jgi:hypothetical protein
MARSLRAAGIATLVGAALLSVFPNVQSSVLAAKEERGPIRISGVNEPDEMLVQPLSATVSTERERMLGQALSSSEETVRLSALNRVIAQYPDFSDAYILRLGVLCKGNDRAAILSDVDNALKFIENSSLGKTSIKFLLSVKAKIEHANGDDRAAIDDLYNAAQSNLEEAISFANSGAVALEKAASICTWTEPDMDALVQRLPNDYRSYMFRGLYHGFFAFFEAECKKLWPTRERSQCLMTKKQEAVKRAFDDLDRAAKIDPSSPLPILLKAVIFQRTYTLQMMNFYNPQHDDLNNTMIALLNAALSIDKNNLEAL